MKAIGALHPDIDAEQRRSIDKIIAENRFVPGSVIGVLRQSQAVVGYLPPALIDHIAWGLNLPRSTVFGVATFYALFSLEPRGRHSIRVCKGTACYVKGIQEVIHQICRQYRIREGETTADRRFSLETVRCLGACGLAPVAVVDGDIHGGVNPDRIVEILEDYD